nr:hypothetical protein [uncultured Cohaesibacter sp.]
MSRDQGIDPVNNGTDWRLAGGVGYGLLIGSQTTAFEQKRRTIGISGHHFLRLVAY